MRYQVTMTHTEKTLEQLSRMQYDLFCKSNRIVRTLLSIGLVLLGLAHSDKWWGILVIAYGCYLTTSTYSSANYTAHKLAKQIRESGMEFPSSRFDFYEDRMEIVPLQKKGGDTTVLEYADVRKIGEDKENFYIFRDNYGGYLVPKSALEDDKAFHVFLENVTGKAMETKMAPVSRLARGYRHRKNTPPHL